jgi:hypothetical protein
MSAKFPLEGNTIYCGRGHGPTFGSGNDIIILQNSKKNCNVGFPRAYIDDTGRGGAVFNTSTNFIVSEVEVFQVR